MTQRHVPVTMGSPRFNHASAAGSLITEAWFPANTVLEPHTHDRPIVAVMLDGAFETAIHNTRLACHAGWTWTEPAGERHANYVGETEAHVIVVQPDPADEEIARGMTALLECVCHLQHPAIVHTGRRIAYELALADSASALAIGGLVMLMLAAAARHSPTPERAGPRPAWLRTVEDLLQAHFRERLDLREIARQVQLHPSHLARSFRARHGLTVGDYVRKLRLDWSCLQLTRTRTSVASIALQAGFSDQSHFGREFRRSFGVTPGQYRAAAATLTLPEDDEAGTMNAGR
jgi:AraC family transcriptional regulator